MAELLKVIVSSLPIALGIGAVLTAIAELRSKGRLETLRQRKIEAVEKKVEENPAKPQLAWELAQVRLESYLSRNLSQVRSIFLLTAMVMTVGFSLVVAGAYEAFINPDHFKASVLSSASGVIVSFVGGTFLILHKSTMAQAKDYVAILERINAVGMTVQILDSLDEGDKDLKHKTTADIAKQLLSMYSTSISRIGAENKKSEGP